MAGKLGWITAQPRFFAALLVCLAGLTQAAPAQLITLADLGTEVTLWDADVALSPDGKRIALIVTRADFIDNRFVRSLLLVDAATGAQRELAPGRTGISSPQWSPDGERLAWLDAASDGKRQIHVATPDEASFATTLTAAPEGVESFEWSPDGASIAFVMPDAAPQLPDEERHNRSFEVGPGHDFLSSTASVPSHLWLIAAQGGPARRLTSGSGSVEKIEWLGDGRIAFLTQPERNISLAVHTVDTRNGDTRVLIPVTPKQPVLALFAASPDGRQLAYARSRGPEPGFRASGIAVIPAAGGESRDITEAIDSSLYDMVWMPDGRAGVTIAAENGRDVMWLQPLDRPARKLDLDTVTEVRHLSGSRSGALAFIGLQARHPAELFYMPSPDSKPRRLTHFNDHLAARRVGDITSIRWRQDDFEQSGVLIYPPDFNKGRKYPLVLDVHGGPAAHYSETFDSFHELLAAQGWLVFCPNYRGSDTAGDAYRRGIINDAAEGPGRDIMAGVAAVQALGIVDDSRMAVSGWSYGGLMTAWLTAHYPVWRAAVAGAAVTDFQDQYNLSDLNAWYGYGLGGSPWVDGRAAAYREQSPITFAHRSRTPTLILAVTGDRRVPIVQSYKLYRALKDNQVPVRFIAYPVDGHFPEDPVHQRDIHRRWLHWIADHFDQASEG